MHAASVAGRRDKNAEISSYAKLAGEKHYGQFSTDRVQLGSYLVPDI